MARVVIVIAYLIITIICVGMSAWATYQGYLSEFGDLALFFAIAVTAGLFACDLIILERRSKGGRLFGLVVALAVFTVASWFANFHFFYKRFVGAEVASQRYERALETFFDNLTKAETAISSQNKAPEINGLILAKLRQVEQEVSDQNKPDIGPKAEGYIRELKKLTDDLGVPFAWPSGLEREATKPQQRAAMSMLRNRIDGALKAKEGTQQWQPTIAMITLSRETAKKPLSVATGSTEADAAIYIKGVRDLAVMTREVERTVIQAFAQNSVTTALSLKPVEGDSAQIVRLTDSWRHGLKENATSVYTIGAGAVAVLVDFMPLLFALMVVKPAPPGTPEDIEQQAVARDRKRRKSNIPDILTQK